MEVQVVSSDTIKPSTPTPPHLRKFDLSLLDQFAPPLYAAVLLFYTADEADKFDSKAKSDKIKSSLSEALTHFYPFAGRFRGNMFIECTDEGATYVETQVNRRLSDVLVRPGGPDPLELKKLLPVGMEDESSNSQNGGPILLVQANFFQCKGLVVGVSLSHKISDACTLATFVKGWSATAMGRMSEPYAPKYGFASLFPPLDVPITLPPLMDSKKHSKVVSRRFVFNGPKIQELKAIVANEKLPRPSRVEAVTSLIWKCAMMASRTRAGNNLRASNMSQMVNARRRLEPPMHDNSIGNILGHYTAREEAREDIDLSRLAGLLRKALQEFPETHLKKVQKKGHDVYNEVREEIAQMLSDQNADNYTFTSWCWFDFYGNGDLGWGKPIWVSSQPDGMKNSFKFMDAREGGGIEVWFILDEEEIKLLETNEELLKFASLNPSIDL